MHAVIKHASVPPTIAKAPILQNTFDLDGHNADIAAICIPIEPKLENPHKAYVDITIDLSFQNLKKK